MHSSEMNHASEALHLLGDSSKDSTFKTDNPAPTPESASAFIP